MPRFKSSVVVGVPVQRAFTYLANLRTRPEYHPDKLEVRMTSSGPLGVGSTFTQRLHSDIAVTTQTLRITQYVPNERVAWEETSTGFATDYLIELEPSNGGARITMSGGLRLSPLMLLLLPGVLLIWPYSRWRWSVMMGRIRERVESRG